MQIELGGGHIGYSIIRARLCTKAFVIVMHVEIIHDTILLPILG